MKVNQDTSIIIPIHRSAAALAAIRGLDRKVGLVWQADKSPTGRVHRCHLSYVRFRLVNSSVGQIEANNGNAANDEVICNNPLRLWSRELNNSSRCSAGGGSERGRDQDFLDLSRQGKTVIRSLPNHGILSELFSL